MRVQVGAKIPPAITLHLDQSIDFKVDSYRFNYFQIDLSDRPLEHAPKRSLTISLTVLAGSGDAYAAMEDEHANPTDKAHTWQFHLLPAAPGREDSRNNPTTRTPAVTICITPSDPTYACARKKRVVLAVRSETGFLEYRLKCVTHTLLTSTGIAAMLENRNEKTAEEIERAHEAKDYKDSIAHSLLRSKHAMMGKMVPPSRQRPVSMMQKRLSSTLIQPLPVVAQDSKKRSLVSTLDSTLSTILADPDEFIKVLNASLAKTNDGNTNAIASEIGATARSAKGDGDLTTSRTTLRATSRATSRTSAFSVRSEASSMQGTRSLKGKDRRDEDLLALERGDWSKVILKARIPAAVRLEWATQELEVELGKRTGMTGARRYCRTIPRALRKKDQEQNMGAVLVSASTGIGSGPLMTLNVLQEIYGDEYRDTNDGHSSQTQVPSLRLNTHDSGIGPQGAAAQDKNNKPLSSRGQPKQPLSSRGAYPKTSARLGHSLPVHPLTAASGAEGGSKESEEPIPEGVSSRVSSRSTQSEGEPMADVLFADDDRLALILYEHNEQKHKTKYSRTSDFLEKLQEGEPAAEVGVNLPKIVAMCLEMKIISTAKSTIVGKRDINGIGRQIFVERAMGLIYPSDDEVVLNFAEFKIMLDGITTILGKPYYANRVRPKFCEKELWARLKEDANPTNRLMRVSREGNFRRRIIKSFGKYNSKTDGKLLRDEFFALCKGELGFTKPQAIGLLEPIGISPIFKSMDLHIFSTIFIAAEEPAVDSRDCDASRQRALDTHHLLHNFRSATSSISADDLSDTSKQIESFQMHARQSSNVESKEILKTGWLYRQELSGYAKIWRMLFAQLVYICK